MRERQYFDIDEQLAKTAKSMMSFSDYTLGSLTSSYKRKVDEVYDLVDKVDESKGEEYGDRAYKIAVSYARNLAKFYNKDNRINCMCPSVMIAGPSNFPVAKKQKQFDAWGTNYKFYGWVETLSGKITDILYGDEIIKSGDVDAAQKLREKLERLEELQETMKQVNAYYRKNKALDGCDLLSDEQKKQLEMDMQKFSYYGCPFPAFELSNNRQNIASVKKRLEDLEAVKDSGSKDGETDFFRYKENVENMRIQIFFDGKPDADVRAVLKKRGFRWAPSVGAWQRQLTDNARYAMKQVICDLETRSHSA